MPMLGPMTPYHQLILAAQYQQQQQQQQILQPPRPQMASQEFFEAMQRFIQLRNAGALSNDITANLPQPPTPTSEAASRKDPLPESNSVPASPKPSNLLQSPTGLNLLQPQPLPVATSSPEPRATTPQFTPQLPLPPTLPLLPPTIPTLNNNHLVKSEDELKREEEMVEDEMKEEEDELDDNEDALAAPNAAKPESNPNDSEVKDSNLVTNELKTQAPPVQGFLSENIKQIQLNWLKKMYEDLQKNKGPMPPSEISAGKTIHTLSIHLVANLEGWS